MQPKEKEVYGCSQEKLPISPELSQPPAHAWPTLCLAMFSVSMYIVTHIAYATGWLTSYPTAVVLWSISAYLSFTPMHDAAHGAIASSQSSYRVLLNMLVGRVCGYTLCAPFVAFRYLHLQHHKYTNVPGKDPDLYSSLSPLAMNSSWLAMLVYADDLRHSSVVVHYTLSLASQGPPSGRSSRDRPYNDYLRGVSID